MNNGRPSELGILEIADDAGNVIDKLNRLRLGPGLSLSKNDNDPSYVIDVIGGLLSSVVIVDDVAALRGMIVPPSVDKIYWTKNYYTPTDTGGMPYRWNATDTTTDDGVLHLKNSFRGTGRFQPIKPTNGMMNAQACGPALIDIGTITRSFDPTGTRSMHTEMKRVSSILRNSGWSGLMFGSDYAGNARYKCSGSEEIAVSTNPWVGFNLHGDGTVLFFNDPAMTTVSVGIGIYMEFEGGPSILSVPYYNSRTWTQAIAGGENTFSNIANIVGLGIGDTVMVRPGADPTDASGWCGPYYYGVINAITPGSGTTGSVQTDESMPEPQWIDNGFNLYRVQGTNDMVKVTGFQDGTNIQGIRFHNVFLALQGYRNLEVDATWESCNGFAINGVSGIGLRVKKMVVKKAYGSLVVPANLVTLAGQYSNRFDQIIVNDIRPLGGSTLNILTEELTCRHTSIGSADITYNAATSPTINFCNQTFGQRDLIYCDHLTVRGGYATLTIGPGCYINVLDDKCGVNHSLFIRTDQVKSLIYFGQLYRSPRQNDYILPIPSTATTVAINLPNHGLSTGLRIMATSKTGITAAGVAGNGSSFLDILGDLSVGVWKDINQGCVMGLGGANYYGDHETIQITTDGTTPAGNALYIRHSVFERDLIFASTLPDTSIPSIVVTNGSPTANSSFLGQTCFDSTNSVWYRSVSVGSGAADWVLSGSNKILDGTVANGYVSMALRAAPSTPPAGKVYAWADSTTRNWTSKDSSGIISVSGVPVSAPAHNWFNSFAALGTFSYSRPAFADLWGGSEVALNDANATITVAGGSYYRLAASTLTGLKTLTLGNTSATGKQLIRIVVESQSSNYLINDSAATLLLSVASGTKVDAEFTWDTGTSKFQLSKWAFFV